MGWVEFFLNHRGRLGQKTQPDPTKSMHTPLDVITKGKKKIYIDFKLCSLSYGKTFK